MSGVGAREGDPAQETAASNGTAAFPGLWVSFAFPNPDRILAPLPAEGPKFAMPFSTHRDALAALPAGRAPDSHRAEQLRRLRLPEGRHLSFPGPRTVARLLVLPLLAETYEVRHRSRTLLMRPLDSDKELTAVAAERIATECRRMLEDLPKCPGADRPYNDLRLFITEARADVVQEYLLEVATYVRILSPRWHPSAKPKPDKPAKTEAERKSDYRRTVAAQADETAEWWLSTLYLNDATPGDRVPASALWEAARSGIGSYVEDAEDDLEWWAEEAQDADDGTPLRPRLPGRNAFYDVADRVLGPRRRIDGVRTYVIPDPS